MSGASMCRCGREATCPIPEVSSLEDSEIVIKSVRTKDEVVRDDTGRWNLAFTAFRKEDLEGKNGKSVSLMRRSHTARDQLIRRAHALNREPIWLNDQIVVEGKVTEIRGVSSRNYVKCACIFADPILESDCDALGVYLGHAALKKHCDFQGKNDPEAWLNFRSDLAELFGRAYHVISGAAL